MLYDLFDYGSCFYVCYYFKDDYIISKIYYKYSQSAEFIILQSYIACFISVCCLDLV